MPITRDADFPVEAAQLVAAFNRCVDGHEMEDVIQAAAMMLSASLHTYARAKKMDRAAAIEFFTDALDRTQANAQDNFDRAGAPPPSAEPVRQN